MIAVRTQDEFVGNEIEVVSKASSPYGTRPVVRQETVG
jgi:hypothetical protein